MIGVPHMAQTADPLAEAQTITQLAANENPFGPSPKAIAAAGATLARANAYPDRTDAALCAALARHHGRGLTPEHFLGANGGVEVLSLIEDACLPPGARAILCPPCFGAYAPSLQLKGAAIDFVPLAGPKYAVDVAGIRAAVTAETRLVYLCNPNNPTGTWFEADVLSAVLDALPEHVTLIYDEVYYQFATETGLPDAIQHVLNGRNIVVVHSFSKAYGLAGLRVGYGIARPDLTAQMQRMKRSFHINSAVMAAAVAALEDSAHLEATITNNHTERRRLTGALQKLGLETTPSQANFVMIRCPGGRDARAMCDALAQRGVMVRPAFDLPHHIRATIGTPTDNDRLLAALTSILEDRV